MNEIIKTEGIPTLKEVYDNNFPLPKDNIVIGVARDGLPILINLCAVMPSSPNIIIWDMLEGQGIRVIKTAIEFILRYETGDRVEFVVFSNRTKEWTRLSESGLGVGGKNECVAIVPFWEIIADQVLYALKEWTRRFNSSSVLLFIDGLENVELMCEESKNNLRNVISWGREKGVYVIGTAKSENRENLSKWLRYFQAEIFGQDNIHWFKMDERNGEILFLAPITTI